MRALKHLGIWAGTVSLLACQPGTMPAPRAVRSTPPVSTAASQPPKPTQAPAPTRILRRPAADSVVLSGALTLDTVYLLASGAGASLTTDGAGVVVAGRGVKLASDGNTVLSNNGASLLAKGGNVVVEDTDALLQQDAALVSNNGSGLISDNGGGIISDNGSAYHLAAVADAGAGSPVAGLAVRVIDLADGHALPVGVDEAGKPVFAVYSDAHGHVELYLPPTASRNVRVVASVPGKADARLRYDLVVPPETHEGTFNDDTAAVSEVIRSCLPGRLELLGNPDTNRIIATLPPGTFDPFRPAVEEVQAAAKAAGMAELGPAAQARVTQRFSDALLAHLDLSSAQVNPALAPEASVEGPVTALMEELLKQLRLATASRLAQDPALFTNAPYVQDLSARRVARGGAPVVIDAAPELTRLLITEYAGGEDQSHKLRAAAVDLGIQPPTMAAFDAAVLSFTMFMLTELISDERDKDGLTALDRAKAQITAECEAERARPVESPRPSPAPVEVAPENVTVATLAGSDAGGRVDGPGLTARFDQPVGLTIASGSLFVTEAPGTIRRVDLANPAHPVRTWVGADHGFADGPPSVARFNSLRCLTADETGTLYVVDQGNMRIRAVAPDGTVSTLAGDGIYETVDGPGSSARFGDLFGIAYDAGRRRLIVPDVTKGHIRAIGLADPTHPVTTLWSDPSRYFYGVAVGADGTMYLTDVKRKEILMWPPGATQPIPVAGRPSFGFGEGRWLDAYFGHPSGIAVAPDGSLLIADQLNHALRRVRISDRAYGLTSTLAGALDAGALSLEEANKRGGLVDGPGATVRFNQPADVTVGPDGRIYVSDLVNGRIRVIEAK